MSREDEEPTLFHKHGVGLFPSNEAAEELIRAIGGNEVVSLRIDNRRNPQRLRAYWAYLRGAVDATGCAPSPDVLHQAIKIGLGYVNAVLLKGGNMIKVAGSISFAKMKETEFIKYFQAAEQWLAEKIGYGG